MMATTSTDDISLKPPFQQNIISTPNTSALRTRQQRTVRSSIRDDVVSRLSYDQSSNKTASSKRSSRRLSTELDELLRWDGFDRSPIPIYDTQTQDTSIHWGDYADLAVRVIDADDDNLDFEHDFGDIAGLSELDIILASARKKLDMLEDNLRGARQSLYIAPALPSHASTGSLRSTISTDLSTTFSNISDEDASESRSAHIQHLGHFPDKSNSHSQSYHHRRGNETSDNNSSIKPDSRNNHVISGAGSTIPWLLSSDPTKEKLMQENEIPIMWRHTTLEPRSSTVPLPRILSTDSPADESLLTSPPIISTSPLTTRIKIIPAPKHISISSIRSSITSTDSYTSGWERDLNEEDDDEDDDSDTEELLHEKFETTWPMPPGVQRTFVDPAVTAVPVSEQWNTSIEKHEASPPIVDTLPQEDAEGRSQITTPTPAPGPTPQTKIATSTSKSSISSSPSPAPSSTFPFPTYSHFSTSSPALAPTDETLALALAEHMAHACLKLRDGSEAEKASWRERMKRAEAVLRGELVG